MSIDARGLRAKSGVLDQISIDWSDLQMGLEHTVPPKKTAVVTGCPLCDKIWNNKEEYKDFVGDEWEESIAIVLENDKPYLYIPIEGDFYYSDTYMQINFCPKCGKRLVTDAFYKHPFQAAKHEETGEIYKIHHNSLCETETYKMDGNTMTDYPTE